ncbi:peptidoglycan-binding protein [Streptomyces sp. SP17KL33]|uniref:peptidoglycan-binding protein n=1 Tax=Streptomyces sp. SP17KL33 TaxID=3002534 RepID=UPI002E79500D|nr:peptidoglycan-binding protein [Streptomyces sp. SP17KL33]MEE1829594.1 peptidoglycan-binding protein [Streptomyces sp. SP17KL33]
METPVFEEIDPGADCECPGCVHWRRVMPYSTRYAHLSHPAARTARNALVVATAAGAALGAGHAVPAVAAAHGPSSPGAVPADEGPRTPQGKKAPLHGPGGRPAGGGKPSKGVRTPPTTRAEIIGRAKKWIADEVPYSMREYWSDGYRQDCSGFVSMAWNLPGNEWTGSLDKFAQRISKDRLEPGDMLLFHNPKDPRQGSHVVLFGGWTDHTRTHYLAYESARPYARRQATPYAYWNNANRYVPYRYKGLVPDGAGSSGAGTDAADDSDDSANGSGGLTDGWTDGSGGSTNGSGGSTKGSEGFADGGTGDGTGGFEGAGAKGSAGPASGDRFPGAAAFGPGARNQHIVRLGQLLVTRGGARFYPGGPGPIWSDADRRATRAFQRAQGWSGRHADGIPGPLTWSYLVTGRGRDIPPAPNGSPGPRGASAVPHRPPVVHRPTGRPAPVRPGTPGGPTAPKSPGAPVTPASHGVLGYPGRAMFRPGADNAFVTRLGKRLVEKGFGKYYTSGPGPRWGESDRRNVEAFQRAQGWRGGAADGYPGPETWRRLFA